MELNFLGDVFLDNSYKVDINLDQFIFNLEYPLSTVGKPAKAKINLGADIPNIKETFRKIPAAVNLANNHIMDYGEEAFLTTIEYLENNNIGFFGAGNKKNNYNNPHILNWDNKKVAILGYCCSSTHPVFGSEHTNGSAELKLDSVIKDVQRCKQQADFIIINLHWGDEEIKYPKPTDVVKAHSIIDAGADLVIGHHAHVIQSIEKYQGKYIFYGLGNFIFPDFDVPAYHNGFKFLSRFKKTQQKPNRQSIMVNINNDLHVSYDTTVFENRTASKEAVKIPRWIPQHQKKYDLHCMYERRKGTIKRFIMKPQVPTLLQVKIFLGMK